MILLVSINLTVLSQDSLSTDSICYDKEKVLDIVIKLQERKSLLQEVSLKDDKIELLQGDLDEKKSIILAKDAQLESKDITIDAYKAIEKEYKKELRKTKLRNSLTIGGLSIGLGGAFIILLTN